MDILEQKRRIISTAIVAVVLTGIIVAVVVSAPLINQIHSRAAQAATSVADAKSENLQAIFDLHKDLARQTASRSELAKALGEYARGDIGLDALRHFSAPRLNDSARLIDNLAALIRYDANGNEVVRVGPMANTLPENIPLPDQLDIRSYNLAQGATPLLLMHSVGIISSDGQQVGKDLLLFSLEPMASVFETQPYTQMCLIDSNRSKRVVLEPGDANLAMRPPGACLAEKAGVSLDQRKSFFRSVLDDGTRVLAFVRPLQGHGWELHMHSAISRVFSDVIRDIVISISVIVLLSSLAGFMVWRSLRPLVQAVVTQASQIARSSEELRLAYEVFEHTQEPIVVCNPSFQVIRANPAFAEITGIAPDSLKQKRLDEFLDNSRADACTPDDIRKQIVAENAWQGEVWLTTTSGEAFPNLLTISPVKNDRGQVNQLVLTFSDITERVKAEKQMLRLAHFDKLTGLPNRAALENHLEQAIQHARRNNSQFALMFLDLDKFKPVNDNYGHQVGDELLRNVGKRLKHCIRSSDVVGRRGGDEFVVITGPLHGDDDAKPIADKIVTVLNDTFHIEGHNIQIGASVGVALYPDHGMTAEDLLKQADAAMYRVKTGGRNAVAYA